MFACCKAATAILDRFLHHAEVITITGKSYRLRNKAAKAAGGEGKAGKDGPAGGTGKKDLGDAKDDKLDKDAKSGNQATPCKKRA